MTTLESIQAISLVGPCGAVHKVRHAREGGGPRKCDSLWQRGGGRGQEHV